MRTFSLNKVRFAPDLIALGVGSSLLVATVIVHKALFTSVLQLTLIVSGISALISGILRFRPKPVWIWICAIFALTFFLIGNFLRQYDNTLGNLTATRSLVPDMATFPGYLVLFGGLIGLVKLRNQGIKHTVDALLNGLMAGLALMAAIWVFILGPLVQSHASPLGVKLVLVCYPPLSTIALVLAIRIAATIQRNNPRAYWYLVLAVLSMLIGDIVYFLADSDLAKISFTLLYIPYGLSTLFVTALALHPSMKQLSQPVPQPTPRYGIGQITLLASSLLVPSLLLFGHPDRTLEDNVMLFIVDAALVGVVTARIVIAIKGEIQARSTLEKLALQDSLTGLPNRRQVISHLKEVLQTQGDENHQVSLIFIDLDQFKVVNDSYGHTYGDRLLQEVAVRLRRVTPPSNLVGRIGGDEFVIIMANVQDVDETTALATKLNDALREPFSILGVDLYLSGSIGISITPQFSHNSADILLRDADLAMYQAKAAGRDAVIVFDAAMSDLTSERLELRNDLRQAIARNELFLVFQPIIHAARGRAVGVEALLRWQHARLGMISPSIFIPVAEESGLIREIGRWVVVEALRTLRDWINLQCIDSEFTIAVNLSAVQLGDSSFVEFVQETLSYYDLPYSRLCLELTESTLMDNFDAAVELLSRLRTLGVKIAIDDFGSGYSSLAYLSRLPVDQLKIDKAFIDPLIGEDTPDETLVSAIVAMGDSLGVETIAEGIETPIQAHKVRELHCTMLQGYLYSRPVRSSKLPAVLQRINGATNVEILGA